MDSPVAMMMNSKTSHSLLTAFPVSQSGKGKEDDNGLHCLIQGCWWTSKERLHHWQLAGMGKVCKQRVHCLYCVLVIVHREAVTCELLPATQSLVIGASHCHYEKSPCMWPSFPNLQNSISSENLHIMLALFSMLLHTYYAHSMPA